MALSESSVRRLKRKAANGSLEVEDLLKVATQGDESDAAILRQLKLEYSWPETGWDGMNRVVPMGQWVNVVCSYLELGYRGLVNFASEHAELVGFSTAVLCEVNTTDSVRALIELGGPTLRSPDENRDLATQLVKALNELLSFKRAPCVDDETTKIVREFIHSYLRLETSDSERAVGICALRGVGDRNSVELIQSFPPLGGAWSGVEAIAIRQIKARLRQTRG